MPAVVRLGRKQCGEDEPDGAATPRRRHDVAGQREAAVGAEGAPARRHRVLTCTRSPAACSARAAPICRRSRPSIAAAAERRAAADRARRALSSQPHVRRRLRPPSSAIGRLTTASGRLGGLLQRSSPVAACRSAMVAQVPGASWRRPALPPRTRRPGRPSSRCRGWTHRRSTAVDVDAAGTCADDAATSSRIPPGELDVLPGCELPLHESCAADADAAQQRSLRQRRRTNIDSDGG